MESFFKPADPPGSSRPHFQLYPSVQGVLTATSERAAALSRNMKNISAVLPKKNRITPIADVTQFSYAPPVDPDFSRLIDNKTVSNERWGSITFLGMERMERLYRSSWRGFLHSLRLMAGILSQLKQAGFSPPDSALFNTNI